jgi:hypothetical protein
MNITRSINRIRFIVISPFNCQLLIVNFNEGEKGEAWEGKEGSWEAGKKK